MLCIVVYLSPGSTNMADVAPVTHNIIFLKMDDSLLQFTKMCLHMREEGVGLSFYC